MRNVRVLAAGAVFACAAIAQSEGTPKFVAADVHVSPKAANPQFRNVAGRGGRYELKNATMVDLVRTAYAVTPDRVVGGPSWLELDRYDVTAKMPPETSPDDRRLMLQALLKERFGLAARKATQPMPAYALTVPRKPLMKEADGEGESGCKPGNPAGDSNGRINVVMNGVPMVFALGPGATIQMSCRNISMAAFATAIKTMFGAPNTGSNAVLDETGLKGNWNFDFHYSLNIFGPMVGQEPGEHLTLFDALEKQAGLKLVQKPVPTEVVVVEKVNRAPAPNPPDVAEALPAVKLPTEFEVADVKPADPQARMTRLQIQPGGRVVVQGMTMRMLLNQAFRLRNRDELVGLPGWADSDRFDINAKAPSEGPDAPPLDNDAVMLMLQALLKDRFQLQFHREERPVSAYSLVAGKPKMKKADPAGRTSCKPVDGEPGVGLPGAMTWRCLNVTMDFFAERLQFMGPGVQWPVPNETRVEGNFDFILSFNPNQGMMFGGRGGGDGAGNPANMAADPGGLPNLFEAIEIQLGLKLEARKRPEQVIVIDHLEQKPTEN